MRIASEPDEYYSEETSQEVLFVEEFFSKKLRVVVVKWLTKDGVGYNRKFFAEKYAKETI